MMALCVEQTRTTEIKRFLFCIENYSVLTGHELNSYIVNIPIFNSYKIHKIVNVKCLYNIFYVFVCHFGPQNHIFLLYVDFG